MTRDTHSFSGSHERGIDRRTILKSIAAAAVGISGSSYALRGGAAGYEVVYNGWGGSYDENMATAFFEPFRVASGIEVRAYSPQNFALLRKQVETGIYQFDFADYNNVKAIQANALNLLEPVDFSLVDRDKLSPEAIDAAGRFNGIPFQSLSLNLVYNKEKFPNGGPNSWADFWDVSRFPGKRALMKGSASDRIVAAALLADGVSKDELYPLDLDRAFNKLDEIKPHLTVVYSGSGHGMQLMRDGEVDMAPMWSGRAWELVDDNVPIELVWNEAFHSTSNWIVARGAPNRANAWRLIDFSYEPERMARYAQRAYYGPLLPSAFDYLDDHVAKRLPSFPDNARLGIVQESEWTGRNLNAILNRFNTWLVS